MEENFPARLRDEIKHSIQRRHEFSMRKLSYCAALLGFGTLKISSGSSQFLDLTSLLYLVPLVAIAFDFYIVSDDFRVKRVGAFLIKKESGSCNQEKEWEKFVNDHDNRFAPFAFFIVTLILLSGATILLLQTSPQLYYTIPWFMILLAIEVWLLLHSLSIRSKLGEGKENVDKGLEKNQIKSNEGSSCCKLLKMAKKPFQRKKSS